jgi:uncharacterized protein YceH (UPF0502 family)
MNDPATESAPPPLDAIEARILAALVEKESTTPEAYPLTANAVQLACNQKTNRDPVLELEAGDVGYALRQLEQRGLVRSVHGARAQRYEHRFAQAYSITLKQQALLCVLMLRGPQTVAELLARCERLQAPDDLDDARQTLERLQQRGLAQRLARQSGQREDRYVHLLCGPVDEASLPAPATPRASARPDESLERRVAELEARIARLEAALGMPAGGPAAD